MVSLREGLMLEDGGVISLVGAGGKTSLMFKLAREFAAAGETILTTTTTKIFEPEPDQSDCVIVSDSVGRLLERARELIDDHLHITMAQGRLTDQGKLIGFTPGIIDSLWRANLYRWIIVEADGAAGRSLKAPADHEPVIPVCTTCLVALAGLSAVGRPLIDRWVFRAERFSELAGIPLGNAITESAVATVFTHPQGLFKNAPAAAARIAFLNQGEMPAAFAAGKRIARLLNEKKNSTIKKIAIGSTRSEPPILECYGRSRETGGRK